MFFIIFTKIEIIFYLTKHFLTNISVFKPRLFMEKNLSMEKTNKSIIIILLEKQKSYICT